MIDFDAPIAMVVTGLLHFLPDHEHPARHLRALMDACAPGSHLVITQVAADLAVAAGRATAAALRQLAIPCQVRDRSEVLGLLGDLEAIEPGLVPMAQWRPDGPVAKGVLERQIVYGAVARKR